MPIRARTMVRPSGMPARWESTAPPIKTMKTSALIGFMRTSVVELLDELEEFCRAARMADVRPELSKSAVRPITRRAGWFQTDMLGGVLRCALRTRLDTTLQNTMSRATKKNREWSL